MSAVMPKRPQILSDAFTAALSNMVPVDADAILLMQKVYNNQMAVSSAILSLQRHAYLDGQIIRELQIITGETDQ